MQKHERKKGKEKQITELRNGQECMMIRS